MSTQIAVRLPDEMVRLVDSLVSSGQVRSRASLVERALAREIRRLEAERDVAILRGDVRDDDLDALIAWGARAPMADLG
ncbi:YlcI/YnfO family protein [Cellulomonas sp. Marseille-Q8402]